MSGVSHLRAVLLALGVSACFSEPGLGTTTDPTGGTCADGQQGCPCYANGTCDGVLACDPTEFLCVPEGCTPGELDCVCVDGSCLSPLVCDGAVCVEGGSSSGSEATTNGSSQSESASTAASESTGGSSSAGTSDATSITSETTSVGTSDTGPPDCDMASCSTCLSCVLQPGAACGPQWTLCSEDSVCADTVGCLSECVELQFCNTNNCCGGLGPEITDKANEVALCQQQACPTACTDYVFYTCP